MENYTKLNHKGKQLLYTAVLLFCCQLASNVVNACNVVSNFSYVYSGQNVIFTNSSTGANKYVWNFGDGNTSTQAAPTHSFALANNYLVTLTAYDTTINGCYDTTQFYVFSGGCNLEAKFRFAIYGSEVNISNESINFGGYGSKHIWDFGDGNGSNAFQPIHTYAGSGPYTIRYVLEDTTIGNCSDTFIYELDLNECNFDADFEYSQVGNGSVKITNTSVNCNSYNIPFDSNGEYVMSNLSPGAHYIFLIGWNSMCTTRPDSAFKTFVLPGCYVNASFYISRDTNSNYSGIIYNSSQTGRPGKTTYKWDFGDGDTSNLIDPVHTYPGQGQYVLCLTLTDSVCTSTYCDTIGFDANGQMLSGTPFSIQVIDATVGIGKAVKATSVNYKLYPNPSGDELNIQSDKGYIQEIRLYDINGKLIIKQLPDTDAVKLDIQMLAKGIYLLNIKDGAGNTQILKVIKS